MMFNDLIWPIERKSRHIKSTQRTFTAYVLASHARTNSIQNELTLIQVIPGNVNQLCSTTDYLYIFLTK